MHRFREADTRLVALLATFACITAGTARAYSRVGLLPLERIGPADPAYDELQGSLRRHVGGFAESTVIDLPAPRGCASSDAHCVARAGAGSEVDVVVFGSVERFSDGYAVRLRTVDVKTAEEHEVKRLVQGGLPDLLGVAELASCQLLTKDTCEGLLRVKGPARAHVLVDARDIGTVPLESHVAVGRHAIRIALDGRSTEDGFAAVSFRQVTVLHVDDRGGVLTFEKNDTDGVPSGPDEPEHDSARYTPHFLATPPPPPPVVLSGSANLTDLPPLPDEPQRAPPAATPPPPGPVVVVIKPIEAPPPVVASPPPPAVAMVAPPETAIQPLPPISAPPPVMPPPAETAPVVVAPPAPVQVAPTQPPAVVVAPPAPSTPTPPPIATSSGRRPPSPSLRMGFIVTASAGGAFLLAGIIAGAVSQAKANTIQTDYKDHIALANPTAAYDTVHTASTTANVFYGLMGLSVVTAGALFLVDQRILFGGAGGDEPLSVGVAPGAVSLGGHF